MLARIQGAEKAGTPESAASPLLPSRKMVIWKRYELLHYFETRQQGAGLRGVGRPSPLNWSGGPPD